MIKPGKILCDHEILNSLDTQVERFSAPEFVGARIGIWVFEGFERRRAAQDRLMAHGVNATVRCAYKPLVHAALEELDFDGVEEIRVRYPVVTGVPPQRFLLEAYPFADLAGNAKVRFEAKAPHDGSALIAYEVQMIRADGSREECRIAAPNKFGRPVGSEMTYSPCGWVRVESGKNPELNCDEPFQTDQEIAFRAAMDVLKAEAGRGEEPFFDRLDMRIEAPFFDRTLPVGHESISMAEAMHEDLYFSALDLFKTVRGLDLEDRTLKPGQVVPVLVPKDGALRLRVSAASDPDLQDDTAATSAPLRQLASVDRWLEPAEIKAHLDDLGGDPFEARSRRGRPVWGTHVVGPEPGLVITAGQHANETSGPVGALRAARQLVDDGRSGFALAPLVNPDGYALFRELCSDHPTHMNHAARFTAAGCDLHHVGRGFENEAHYIAREKTGAKLHMNLHGYPAHEWTRPFTGYLPRGAEMWSIPRGFLLILLYNPGWEEQGRAILDAVIDGLAAYTPIIDFNDEQRARSSIYSDGFPFPHRGGVPYIIEERPEEMFPVTIITEAPDETVHGETFRLLHTAQMKAVLSAAEACRVVFR